MSDDLVWRTDIPAPSAPDSRDGLVYVVPEEVKLAVNVALATGRPLLLRGDPGTGKSSLAAYLARQLKWRYYELVISSRTQTQDLLWSFDMVRRLADAQATSLKSDVEYVEPGILWWAFDAPSARRRGLPPGEELSSGEPVEPYHEENQKRNPDAAVLLIDEIDKAEPDVPNGILVALGSNEFEVTEIGITVRPHDGGNGAGRHLIIITTNEERELPQAFLRRCVVTWLTAPDPDMMRKIIRKHNQPMSKQDEELADALIKILPDVEKEAKKNALRPPSIAEVLDTFRACRGLEIRIGSSEWKNLVGLVLTKRQQPEDSYAK